MSLIINLESIVWELEHEGTCKESENLAKVL
jgi:hypothetical protein